MESKTKSYVLEKAGLVRKCEFDSNTGLPASLNNPLGFEAK